MMIHERSFDRPVASPVSTSTLCTSRDSKSSPFQSATTGGDDASVIEDAGHFEDIGLDDDHAVLKYTPFHGARRASPSPGPRSRPGSSHGPPTRNLAGNGASRPLKPRRSFPNIYANGHAHISDPRSTNLSVLTDPRPLSPSGRRKNCNQSTPALPLLSRRRSPSPAQSLLARDPNIPTKLRRESWQTNSDRKSLVQLEQQVEDDEDDDIPNGLVLDNVPISPRPARDRPPSRTSSRAASASASPERPQKERMRSIGNGTPPVAQAQGSLRSPYWRAIGQTPKAPRSPLKARALSWNAAHLELSPETRDLTEKLEEHAAGLEQIEAWRARRPSATARPNTWDSSRPSADYHFDKKERVKSTPELPPLRRSNIMIDPLPVSKEKEAVLSRTRPSWLPPKDPAEERRHLREYQKMMAASAKADERREAARRTKTECKDSTAESMMSVWEKEVIPRWRDALRETRTREMWWRGIPPRSRGTVWAHALGNDLGLTGASYHAALSRATDLQLRVKEGRGDAEDVRRCNWFGDIRSDVSKKTWTDLRIFQQEGPLHQSLVDVLSAYAMYRSDIGHVCGCNTIAALFLLNLGDPESTFITLANTLNRPLPLSFYTSDVTAQASAYNLVLRKLSVKSPSLYEHLKAHGLGDEPDYVLADMFLSLFTQQLAIDEVSRLWDVYVFEGDAILVTAAVSLLVRNEAALLGATSLAEIRNALLGTHSRGGSCRPVGEAGADDAFVKLVRETGKTSK